MSGQRNYNYMQMQAHLHIYPCSITTKLFQNFTIDSYLFLHNTLHTQLTLLQIFHDNHLQILVDFSAFVVNFG